MITIEKLQKMIEKFGETELDKLCSWFPQEGKENIKEIILKSDSLICDNGVVKNIQISIKKTEDISYDGLINIIDKYNEKIKKEYENKKNNREELKLESIKTFLLEKNTLKLFEHIDIADIYIQMNKKTRNENYCVITKLFNKELFDYLDNLFDDEVVTIYYINTDFKVSTVKDFFTKDCNEIIKKYIKSYKLEETSVNISKIIEKIGD